MTFITLYILSQFVGNHDGRLDIFLFHFRLLDLFRTVFPYKNKVNYIMDTEKVHSIRHCHVGQTMRIPSIALATGPREGIRPGSMIRAYGQIRAHPRPRHSWLIPWIRRRLSSFWCHAVPGRGWRGHRLGLDGQQQQSIGYRLLLEHRNRIQNCWRRWRAVHGTWIESWYMGADEGE